MRSLNCKILFYLLALWGGLVVVSFLGLLRLNAIDQASDELLEGVYPASAAAIEEATREEATDVMSRTGNETILLVEDDANVRDVTQKMLAKQEYTILTATNGVEGLDIFRTHQEKIDLVITDVVMPKLSGLELSAEVARQNARARRILNSRTWREKP